MVGFDGMTPYYQDVYVHVLRATEWTDSLRDLVSTILETNLEAAREIVRQIRLRDLGGIIVADFIDMEERKSRKRVMQALEQELRRDRAPSKLLQVSEFGLVVITRKRVIWRLAPLGARTAASRISRRSSTGIGSGRKRRIDRWVNIASPIGIESRAWSMPAILLGERSAAL